MKWEWCNDINILSQAMTSNGQHGVPKIGFPVQFGNGTTHFHAYALGSAVPHMCFQDAKAQELPRLNRLSMHDLATGTFIFCRAFGEHTHIKYFRSRSLPNSNIYDRNLRTQYKQSPKQGFDHLYKKVRMCAHTHMPKCWLLSKSSYETKHPDNRTMGLSIGQPRWCIFVHSFHTAL